MGSGGRQEIRYASHIEDAHNALLRGDIDPTRSIFAVFNSAFVDAVNAPSLTTPYGAYEVLDVDRGFFGMTPNIPGVAFNVENYPALYDMFGQFLGGLDVHSLWALTYEDVVHGPEITNAVSSQAQLNQDSVNTTILPPFLAGMRDINAIQSTAFVIGKANIARQQVIAINEFQTKLRFNAIQISVDLWKRHLDWSRDVVTVYTDVTKSYYDVRMTMDRQQLEYAVKDRLWNMNLFDEVRAVVGALNGAAAATGKTQPSQLQKSIAGTLGGAATGASVGGPYGAAIGAVIGLGASFIQ